VRVVSTVESIRRELGIVPIVLFPSGKFIGEGYLIPTQKGTFKIKFVKPEVRGIRKKTVRLRPLRPFPRMASNEFEIEPQYVVNLDQYFDEIRETGRGVLLLSLNERGEPQAVVRADEDVMKIKAENDRLIAAYARAVEQINFLESEVDRLNSLITTLRNANTALRIEAREAITERERLLTEIDLIETLVRSMAIQIEAMRKIYPALSQVVDFVDKILEKIMSLRRKYAEAGIRMTEEEIERDIAMMQTLKDLTKAAMPAKEEAEKKGGETGGGATE